MPVPDRLLSQTTARTTQAVPLLPEAEDLRLARGRVHEACGSARHRLALWLAAQTQGPILWVAPAWGTERLNPCGLMPFLDPARLILVHPKRPEDVLWSMEEVLRSGAVSLAVADLPGLPGLTPVRRMHLAAETGSKLAPHAPVGLLMTPGDGGAQGVESRWRLSPDHQARPGVWTLTRLRARAAPVQSWQVARVPGTPLPRVTQTIRAA